MEGYTGKFQNKFEGVKNIVKRVVLAGFLVTVGCNTSQFQNQETETKDKIEDVHLSKAELLKNFFVEVGGIKIEGDAEFTSLTTEALNLLLKLPEMEVIKSNIGIIKMWKASGMNVYATVPTFEVGEPTYTSSSVWYASSIAHDSYHAHLYKEAKSLNQEKEPDSSTWTGREAEVKCMKFQLEVLKKITTDEDAFLVLYAEDNIKNDSKYQDIPNSERNW